jgi:NADH:ubiquinone oxidoreductase subunit E
MEALRSRVCEILKKFDAPWSEIVAVLREVQKAFGCLPEEALKEVADRTGIAPIRLADVVNSNHGLVLEKDIKRAIEVCTCPNCTVNGGAELLRGLREILLVKSCGKGIGTRYYISAVIAPESPCPKPPTVTVNGQRYHNITLSKLLELIDSAVLTSRKRKCNVKSAT